MIVQLSKRQPRHRRMRVTIGLGDMQVIGGIFKGSSDELGHENHMILGRRVIRDIQENAVCGKSGAV